MIFKPLIAFFLIFICSIPIVNAQNIVTVNIYPYVQKYIGNISTLERNKYFNMHGTGRSNEFTAQEKNYLFKTLRIGFGRSLGGPGGSIADSKEYLTQAAANEKITAIQKKAATIKLDSEYATSDYVLTDHPRNAFRYRSDYAAGAKYFGDYLKYNYNSKNPLPKYYEVMNEPFVHTNDFDKNADSVILQMSTFHALLADQVHEKAKGMMIGGYSAAYPEYELNDFSYWNTRMKKFMDVAGDKMDFLSIHIYDGANVEGDAVNRSGSNAEALLDLIQTYSFIKWGKIKPIVISEFGMTNRAMQPIGYNRKDAAQVVSSVNNLMKQFMNRPDKVIKTVPFITGKSDFFSQANNGRAYPWVIMKKDESGIFQYTDYTKFYEAWKDVDGDRVEINVDNPDVLAQAFANEKNFFVCLKNLDGPEKKVNLKFDDALPTVKDYLVKRLFIKDSLLQYSANIEKNISTTLSLQQNELVILEYHLKEKIKPKQKLIETAYFAENYIEKIEKNKPVLFKFDNVNASLVNSASLRVGINREHGKSLHPIVKVNGTEIMVPQNFAGYDQASRKSFFGAIEIPVPANLIKEKNTIEILFDDIDGGRVSSVVLNVAIKK